MRQLEAMEKIFAKNRKNRILPEVANGGMPMDLVTFIVTESGQETENPSMFILRDDMIEAGIESISEVKFKYYIFEFEDLDHPIISDEITILSSLNDNH